MFFFFKPMTAYEMRISDWSSDVCSSDLAPGAQYRDVDPLFAVHQLHRLFRRELGDAIDVARLDRTEIFVHPPRARFARAGTNIGAHHQRSGRGEKEAIIARRDRRFDQVQRDRHIDIDEGLPRIADDVWLVQREDRKSTRLNSSH